MSPELKSSRPGFIRRLGPAGPAAVALSFCPAVGGLILLTFLTRLGPWLRAQDAVGMGIYVLIAGTLLGVSFVPTFACSILAGWAFGFARGWPLTLVAITVGSLLAYAIGRWIVRDRVVEMIEEKPSWNAVYRALLGPRPLRTTFVIILLRLPPSSPFALTNFVLAAARVPWREYAIGTLVGIGPRTAVTVLAAAQLEQLQFKNVGESWTAAAEIAVAIIVGVVLGTLARRALRQITPERPESQ